MVSFPEFGDLCRTRLMEPIAKAGMRLEESVWTPPIPRLFWYAVETEIRIVHVFSKEVP